MNAIPTNGTERDAGMLAQVNRSRPLPRPEALLFDLDGVLADVSESYRVCIQRTAAHFGSNGIDIETIDAAKRAGNANNDWVLTRRLLESQGLVIPLEAVRTVFQNLYLGTKDVPGLREHERLLVEADLLRQLTGRFALGIVTGRPSTEAVWFLDRFGVQDCFRTIVALGDAPEKPDPAPVRLAMQQLGVASAWMIGDTPDDMRAGIQAGVLCIGVAPGSDGSIAETSGNQTALFDAGASAVITQVSQLESLLP